MTFRQVITPDDGDGVKPHAHDGSEVSGEGTFITLRVNRLLAGTINGKEVIIAGGVAGIIRSDNFDVGVDGWQILGDGSAEFNDVVIRGTIIAGSGSQIGFDDIAAGENVAALVIGASGTLESSDFVTGVSGWQILGDGSAEFQDVTVRGVITSEAGSDVDWTHISDVSVGTADIENAAITNAKINDLSADKITAGTLDADRISAKSLTVEKLTIGSTDNLIQNPGAELNTLDPHAQVSGGGAWSVGTVPRSGAKSFQYDSTSQSSEAALVLNGPRPDMNSHPSAAEGDTFYFEAYGEYGGTGPGNDLQVLMSFRDEAGSNLGSTASAVLSPTTDPQKMTVEATAPAGSAYVVFELRVQNDGNDPTSNHHFDDCYARRKIGTLVIDDQAVDIERMLDPVHSDASEATPAGNVTLSTSFVEKANFDFTVPTWVGTATVFGTAVAQMSNNTAGAFNLSVSCRVGDSDDGSFTGTIPVGSTVVIPHFEERTIVAPGSTVQVSIYARVNTGTGDTPNVLTCWGTISGLR